MTGADRGLGGLQRAVLAALTKAGNWRFVVDLADEIRPQKENGLASRATCVGVSRAVRTLTRRGLVRTARVRTGRIVDSRKRVAVWLPEQAEPEAERPTPTPGPLIDQHFLSALRALASRGDSFDVRPDGFVSVESVNNRVRSAVGGDRYYRSHAIDVQLSRRIRRLERQRRVSILFERGRARWVRLLPCEKQDSQGNKRENGMTPGRAGEKAVESDVADGPRVGAVNRSGSEITTRKSDE